MIIRLISMLLAPSTYIGKSLERNIVHWRIFQEAGTVTCCSMACSSQQVCCTCSIIPVIENGVCVCFVQDLVWKHVLLVYMLGARSCWTFKFQILFTVSLKNLSHTQNFKIIRFWRPKNVSIPIASKASVNSPGHPFPVRFAIQNKLKAP